MLKRVYSLETEYALVWSGRAVSGSYRLPTESLYEQIEAELLSRRPHASCDPTIREIDSSDASIVEVREGHFLVNGARIYFDNGHLEWAAPEASNPYDALVYDRAGELELAAVASTMAEQMAGVRLLIAKNNLDYQTGSTYGCHENYSIRRYSRANRDVMRQIRENFLPFLVTRQILCGAGRVGASHTPGATFQLAQRSDFITCEVSVDTRENRPIINLRDEPLADEDTYARLHLILGDSNLAEHSTFLKLGTTGLLLDMIEQDAVLPNLALSHPVEAMRVVSRDLQFTRRLPLKNGGSITAVDVQRAYWRAARDFAHQRGDDPRARQIIQIWGDLLQDIERQSPALDCYLDWAIKRRLLSGLLERADLTWDVMENWEPVLMHTQRLHLPAAAPRQGWRDWIRRQLPASEWDSVDSQAREQRLGWDDYPRVRQIAAQLRAADIRYHDIDPRRGLFHCWGHAEQVIADQAECQTARERAPQDTRAAVRERAIRLAQARGEAIRMDWDRIQLTHSKRTLSLPDPVSSDVTALNRLWGLPVPPTRSKPVEDDIEIIVLDVEDISGDNT